MGALITGVALNLTGYVPNAEQSLATLTGIRFIMVGIPIIFVVISFIIYKSKFKLTGAYYDKIMNILALRKEELDEHLAQPSETVLH